MRNRIAQPPINPALRPVERHEFWPAFVAVLIGAILTFVGSRHLTGIDTVQGETAWETQLVKAFSSGGLQYASHLPPAPPPKLDDPAASAQALERWARQTAAAQPPKWKIRIDAGAKQACPT